MSQADMIRAAAIDRYIRPGRTAGRSVVTIRAGDLHSAVGLRNAMPAVCSAIRSAKFDQLAGVRRLGETGPANGANVYFRFELTGAAGAGEHEAPPAPRVVEPRPAKALAAGSAAGHVDLSNALVLVSCVKSKLPHVAPARQLYTSDWFTKVRRLVEGQGARWFVLSALHGLVPADQEIAPYELTLNTMGVAERRTWAARVFQALEPELKGYSRVVFFAGERYREFLVPPIRRAGLRVEVPMEGLAIGEQLAWLSARA